MTQPRLRSDRTGYLYAVALLALTAVAYSNSFSVPYLFDDFAAIPDNPTIRTFTAALFPPVETTVYGRPVLNLSFALNHAISGTDVWSYHLLNLLIHAAAGLTLFGIMRRTLETAPLRDRFGSAVTPLAAAVAGLWLLHPTHTESVTYIVQRAEALVGLFAFLTLYAVIRSAASSGPLWPTLAIIFCALGMGTKEVMATVPFLILLYDRTYLAGTMREALRQRRGLHIGLFATLLIVLALAAKGRPGSAGFGEGMAWYEYARTQPGVILHYLRLSIIPWPLVFDYLWPVTPVNRAIIPGLILLVIVAVALWGSWRNRPAAFAALWFLLILAPSSSVIPIVTEVAAEHRLYLPLAAISALVVLGSYARLGANANNSGGLLARRAVLSGAAAVTVIFAAMTYMRNIDYRTPVILWSDTVEKRPGNVRAHYNLAKALEEEGRIDEAIRQYTAHVLRLKPDYAEAHANVGLAQARRGQLDEAMTHFEAALKAKPGLAEAHNNMGLTLAQQDRTEEALARYAEAVRLKPSYAEAHYNMANALAGAGRLQESISRYNEAIRHKPDFPAAHMNLAISLEQSDMPAQAITHYREAIRLRPNYTNAHLSLGMLYARQGNTVPARHHLEAALRLEPNLPPARQALERLTAGN